MSSIDLSGDIWQDLKHEAGQTVRQVAKVPGQVIRLPGRVIKGTEKTVAKVGDIATTGIKTVGGIGTTALLGVAALVALILYTQRDTISHAGKKSS